jgi:hypothetical protein
MTEKKLKILLILLGILQILDGALTYYGVVTFGSLEIEGNPLIKYLMSKLGPAPALISAKTLACLLVYMLYRLVDCSQSLITTLGIYLVTIAYLFTVIVWIIVLAR